MQNIESSPAAAIARGSTPRSAASARRAWKEATCSSSASSTASAGWCKTDPADRQPVPLRHPHQRGNHPRHQPRQAHKMSIGGKIQDMTAAAVETYQRTGSTPSSASAAEARRERPAPGQSGAERHHPAQDHRQRHRPHRRLFRFDTALGIATEAVDRLHSTATSHDRVIVLETMGHRAGWLALGAGLAGGADVILIPEIPHRVDAVAEAINNRARSGKRFSIVVVAEGSMTVDEAEKVSCWSRRKTAPLAKKKRKRPRTNSTGSTKNTSTTPST